MKEYTKLFVIFLFISTFFHFAILWWYLNPAWQEDFYKLAWQIFFVFLFGGAYVSIAQGEQCFSPPSNRVRPTGRQTCLLFLVCVSPILLSSPFLFSRSYTRAVGLRHVFSFDTKKEKGSPRASLSSSLSPSFSFEAERNEGAISLELPHDLRCFVRPHQNQKQTTSNVGLCFCCQFSPHLTNWWDRKKNTSKKRQKAGARAGKSMDMGMYFRKTQTKWTNPVKEKHNQWGLLIKLSFNAPLHSSFRSSSSSYLAAYYAVRNGIARELWLGRLSVHFLIVRWEPMNRITKAKLTWNWIHVFLYRSLMLYVVHLRAKGTARSLLPYFTLSFSSLLSSPSHSLHTLFSLSPIFVFHSLHNTSGMSAHYCSKESMMTTYVFLDNKKKGGLMEKKKGTPSPPRPSQTTHRYIFLILTFICLERWN